MKTLLLFVLSISLGMVLHAQPYTAQLDSLFKATYASQEPGVVVAIELNGKKILEKGYGLADLSNHEPLTATTNLNIGSLTKQFTAYAILRLAAQKRLSLDDKLIAFFPSFNPKTGGAISIRQLLTHSSGIVDHYAFTDTTKVKHATDQDVFNAVARIDSTYFIPGTEYRYSNTAYCLLALVIEKLSGQPYRDYIRKNIFQPLAMNHSVVLRIGDAIFQRATGYDRENMHKPFFPLDADQAIFFSTEGDGGIYTSINDYMKWCHALQQGNLLDRKIVEAAGSPQFRIDSINRLSYGFGWFVSEKDHPKAVYHTGSNGGFRAMVFTIPDFHYIVVMFSNRTDIDLENMLLQINRILHIHNKSFSKIESLVSFIDCWPNFAPCKEIPLFLTSSKKSLNASVMALN